MPLYMVATPIGNLEDISLRALRTLREVKLIAAEDTRRTKQLLVSYDIKTPTTSYHERNKLTKLDYILDCLSEGDVALVSDAGMPGISAIRSRRMASRMRFVRRSCSCDRSLVTTATVSRGIKPDGTGGSGACST